MDEGTLKKDVRKKIETSKIKNKKTPSSENRPEEEKEKRKRGPVFGIWSFFIFDF